MIIPGNNIDVLRCMADESIDAVVTDPPYGLSFMGKKWDYDVPSTELWREVLRVLKPGGHLLSFGGTRTYHRVAVNIEDAGFEIRDSLHWMYGSGFPKSLNLGEGRGTALKPAHEPIVLARRPVIGTVTANVAEHGTGGLRVDDCRAALASGEQPYEYRYGPGGNTFSVAKAPDGSRTQPVSGNPAGRWPPNVLLDSAAAAALDGQSATSITGKRTERSRDRDVPNTAWGNMNHKSREYPGDTGGASRFYPVFDHDDRDIWPFQYVAKTARSEREAGCGHLPSRTGAEAVEREAGSAGVQNPRAGAGRTAKEVRNHHPTVKPVALMRWLVRLVTPRGGVCLDPFAGSGSTLVACELEGLVGVGIEREPEYVDIAVARISHVRYGGE